MPSAVMVLAKAPVPGRVKTRLVPPCSHREAAGLAEAALHDTLAAVREVTADRHVLVLDGRPGPWLPPDFEVVAQCDGGLDVRLAAAFASNHGPTVLVGMDTPQLSSGDVELGLGVLDGERRRASLGLANDGGYWIIGLPEPDDDAFVGVPMSRSDTGVQQRQRLEARGYEITLLPPLRDIDRYDDAVAVAALAPSTRFARELARVVGA